DEGRRGSATLDARGELARPLGAAALDAQGQRLALVAFARQLVALGRELREDGLKGGHERVDGGVVVLRLEAIEDLEEQLRRAEAHREALLGLEEGGRLESPAEGLGDARLEVTLGLALAAEAQARTALGELEVVVRVASHDHQTGAF